jgi:hypothetical protein
MKKEERPAFAKASVGEESGKRREERKKHKRKE